MWAGSVASIPSGWNLCDGTNGTPNLSDRFIKGTTGTPGSTGGAATHGHTVTQPAQHAALTHSGAAVGNHANHTHTYSQVINHTHVITASNTAATSGSNATRGSGTQSSLTMPNPSGGVASGTTGNESATQTHSVTQPDNHAAMSHTGAAVDSVNNEPAYYTLAFIQKA